MTIAISCNLSDGVVLGADSAITLSGQVRMGPEKREVMSGVLNIYHDAEKLFQLSNLPVGILAYGNAIIEKRTIRSHIKQFESDGLDPNKTVKDICEDLRIYFDDKLPQDLEARGGVGFVIGGYSPGKSLSEIWELKYKPKAKDSELREIRAEGNFGANWFGSQSSIVRLMKGYDPAFVNNLLKLVITELKVQPEPEVQGRLRDKVQNLIQSLEYITAFDGMTLQEGINYVRFLLDTAINQSRYTIGPDTCGGDVRIAVVMQKEFKDITHRELR